MVTFNPYDVMSLINKDIFQIVIKHKISTDISRIMAFQVNALLAAKIIKMTSKSKMAAICEGPNNKCIVIIRQNRSSFKIPVSTIVFSSIPDIVHSGVARKCIRLCILGKIQDVHHFFNFELNHFRQT